MDIGTFLFSSTLNTKTLPSTTSDEDDHDHDHHLPSSSAATPVPAKNPSPWHRMKWTDDIVRLLINLVSFVGDDVAPSSSAGGGGGGGGGGVLHKKAKWKTVSKLMLDNGCYVSPQQCEDKFNDLNKRYKRLNEILGRGTTCQVVENPSLLDSMHHIPEKSKVDVRKILSSKHLFYREMCAYHNGQRIPNSHELEVHDRGGLRILDVSEEGDEEEDEEEEEEEVDGVGKSRVASMEVEISGLTEGEKRGWLRKQALQLLEERVEIEAQGLKLEEKRAKWERFKRKKDWEMEKSRMENERLDLENERMVLQVRRKEMELESSLMVEGNGMMMFGEHGRVQ